MADHTWADILLVNGTLHTGNPGQRKVSALAITGRHITAVGDAREVTGLRSRQTQVIDLRGGCVTPGLTDAHTHPVLGLDAVAGADLSGCADLSELRNALSALVADTPEGGWLTGWGIDPNAFGNTPIGWAAIEDVLDHRPTYLTLFDGHAAIASREALRRAGIGGAREFGTRASLVCDEHGAPTGHLKEESAMNLVAALVPPESFTDRCRRLKTLLDDMAATGLTGGHVMDADGDALDLLAALDNDDQLPLRLRLAPWCRPDDDPDRREQLMALQQRRGRLWQIAGVKLFLDGTIDGGTAWLSAPDSHGESTSPYWPDPHQYSAAVRHFAAAGVQTATHAIGDAAVRFVLDTLTDCPGRHRIEHIETLPADQVLRFAPLGVTASMQPTHATDYTRADGSDNWSQRLGPRRAARGWPCRELADSGAVLALGSDWPVAPYDPRRVLCSAQTRRPADRHATPVQPGQRLTARQALHGYTAAPAQAAGTYHETGRVAPGYLADLTVFHDDPLQVPAAELPALPIDLTIVDGRVRHQAE